MSENKDRILRKIREVLLMEHREGPCVRFELKHIVLKGDAGHVQTYNISADTDRTESLCESMAESVETDAETDGDGNGGLQRYQLLFYHESDPNKPVSRLAFRCGDGSEIRTADSEPATTDGILAQQMRHNEALMRTQVQSVNNILQIQQRSIEKLQTEKERLENDRFRFMEVHERMLSEAHSRHLAEQETEFEMLMKKQVADKLMMLAPTVVNRLTGHKILPEKTTPKDEMIKNLSKSIMGTPGKIEKIMSSGLFTMEELTVIASLLDGGDENNEEKKEN
jgi:hypothetical protein